MTRQARPRTRDAGVAALHAEARRLREEARAKDELLAVVAHELRARLAAIRGGGALIARRGSEEEFQTGLEVIAQSVQVQGKLIEDLLVLSLLSSNPHALE